MRRDGKVDANQIAIVTALRRIGASVAILSPMGAGIPDLLIGWRGTNILAEVKNGTSAKMTPTEREFFENWRGHAEIIHNIDEALELLNLTN